MRLSFFSFFLALGLGFASSLLSASSARAEDQNCNLIPHYESLTDQEAIRFYQSANRFSDVDFSCSTSPSLAACPAFRLYCAQLKMEALFIDPSQNKSILASKSDEELNQLELGLAQVSQSKKFSFNGAAFARYQNDLPKLQAKYQQEHKREGAFNTAKKLIDQCSGVVALDDNDVKERHLSENITRELNLKSKDPNFRNLEIDTTGASKLKKQLDQKSINLSTKELSPILDSATRSAIQITAKAIWAIHLKYKGPLTTLAPGSNQSPVRFVCGLSTLCQNRAYANEVKKAFADFQDIIAETPIQTFTEEDLKAGIQEMIPGLQKMNQSCKIAHDQMADLKKKYSCAPKFEGFLLQNKKGVKPIRAKTAAEQDQYCHDQVDELYRQANLLQDETSEKIDSQFKAVTRTPLGHLFTTEKFRTQIGQLEDDYVYNHCLKGNGQIFKTPNLVNVKTAMNEFYHLNLKEMPRIANWVAQDADAQNESLKGYLKSNPAAIAEVFLEHPERSTQRSVCTLIREMNSHDHVVQVRDGLFKAAGGIAIVTLTATGIGAPIAAGLVIVIGTTSTVVLNSSYSQKAENKNDRQAILESASTGQFELHAALSQMRLLDRQNSEISTEIVMEWINLLTSGVFSRIGALLAETTSATAIAEFLGMAPEQLSLLKAAQIRKIRLGLDLFKRTAKSIDLPAHLWNGLNEEETFHLGALFSRIGWRGGSRNAVKLLTAIKEVNDPTALKSLLHEIALDPESFLSKFKGGVFETLDFKKLLESAARPAYAVKIASPPSEFEFHLTSAKRLLKAYRLSRIQVIHPVVKAAMQPYTFVKDIVINTKNRPFATWIYANQPIYESKGILEHFTELLTSPPEKIVKGIYTWVRGGKHIPGTLGLAPSTAVTWYLFWKPIYWLIENPDQVKKEEVYQTLTDQEGGTPLKILLDGKYIQVEDLKESLFRHRKFMEDWVPDAHTPLRRLELITSELNLPDWLSVYLNQQAHQIYQNELKRYGQAIDQYPNFKNKKDFFHFNAEVQEKLIAKINADEAFRTLTSGEKFICSTVLWPVTHFGQTTDVTLLKMLYSSEYRKELGNIQYWLDHGNVLLGDAFLASYQLYADPDLLEKKRIKAARELPETYSRVAERPDLFSVSYPKEIDLGTRNKIKVTDEIDRWKQINENPIFSEIKQVYLDRKASQIEILNYFELLTNEYNYIYHLVEIQKKRTLQPDEIKSAISLSLFDKDLKTFLRLQPESPAKAELEKQLVIQWTQFYENISLGKTTDPAAYGIEGQRYLHQYEAAIANKAKHQ